MPVDCINNYFDGLPELFLKIGPTRAKEAFVHAYLTMNVSKKYVVIFFNIWKHRFKEMTHKRPFIQPIQSASDGRKHTYETF